ncbi:VOC family protein [Actinomycetospora sp. OC33-EN08]|uniref:VOC family protein n=1 Tax=Actinomycetospora aurantiaca TaxID=3129233 RepID=A0ABU8MP54_9PSEU
MAIGIATVWVPVNDMKRAVTFYRDVLELRLTSEGDQWTEFDANGLTIGLNAYENAQVADEGGAVITFQPEGTLEEARDTIRSRGADVQDDISDHSWGRILPFRDTEGNDLQFYTPPAG